MRRSPSLIPFHSFASFSTPMNNHPRFLFTVFLGLVVLSGSGTLASELDTTIEALMAKRKVPGLSLAVIKDGEIVHAKGYGVVDRERGTSVTPDTLFQAGSISKPIAAMGALLLVDRKKLSLDEDVNRSLRSWKVPENEHTAGNPVTLRRLLSHSAGLTVHGFPGYVIGRPVPTVVQVLDGEPPANTAAVRVDVTPGSRWRYSGGGYTVAQQLVVDAAGATFPEFMRREVLEPLGMRASTFEQAIPEAWSERTATGHARGRAVPGRWHVYPEMAAAGLWTTASDLARAAIAHQKAFAGGTHPVLSAEAVRLMVTVEKGSFGLGFSVAKRGGWEQFAHNGRDEGFDAMLLAYRDRGYGVVVMINANENSSFMPRVISAVAQAYDWPDYPPYRSPQPIDDQEPAVTELIRKIMDEAREGRLDRALYVPALADQIAAAVPGSATTELKALGAIQSLALVARREEGGSRQYRYLLTAENDIVMIHCTIRPDGVITGLLFQPE